MEAHAVTTVICRNCHAELAVTADVCDRCGTRTNENGASHPSAVDESSAQQARLLDRPWFLIVLILHLGVLGIPAYWATGYSLPTRLLIVTASILYTAFAVVVIVWSLRQIANLF